MALVHILRQVKKNSKRSNMPFIKCVPVDRQPIIAFHTQMLVAMGMHQYLIADAHT
jgi:hypothetical protein